MFGAIYNFVAASRGLSIYNFVSAVADPVDFMPEEKAPGFELDDADGASRVESTCLYI